MFHQHGTSAVDFVRLDDGVDRHGNGCPCLGGEDHYPTAQLRVPLLWRGGAADIPRRNGLAYFSVLRTHQPRNRFSHRRCRCTDESQHTNELGEMVNNGPRWNRHRLQTEQARNAGLDLGSLRAKGREGSRRPTGHRCEQARRDLLEAVEMPDHLIDPSSDLESERDRHRMLPVGPARLDIVGGALSKIGQAVEQFGELSADYLVGIAEGEYQAWLLDVLSRVRGR